MFYGGDAPGPDHACVIETPTDALGVRLQMIRSAKKSLDLATHIMKDSPSSRAFLGEILAAANRGVQVRIIADGKITWLNGTMTHMLEALDSHPNISCKVYAPLQPLKAWQFHIFLHDKFMIADGQTLLLGGRNVDERHYNPSGFDRPITHDRDVFVWKTRQDSPQNPSAVDQTIAYMNALWTFEDTKPITDQPLHTAKAAPYLNAFAQAAQDFKRTDPKFYAKSFEDFKRTTVPTRRITLIYNPLNVSKKEPWVAYQLQQLALSAQKSVVLQTPYATKNTELLQTMATVADRVQATMITNSLESSPNFPAFSNYYGSRQKFVDTGFAIYEYQLQDSIHAKSMIVDERISAVGSFNMDDRSIYLDTETMLVIDSVEFATQLSDVVHNIQNSSLQVGTDNEYMPSEFMSPQPKSVGKRALMAIVYTVLRPFQFLL